MSLSTHIQGLALNELLQVISNGRLSGVLTVVSQFRTGRIVFTWGRVTHASTDTQGRLGEVLLREGVISSTDLQTALEFQKGQSKQRPIGTVLQSMGLAEKSTITGILKDQMRRAFFEVIEWTDGVAHLQIDMATALASVKLDVSLDTQSLLLDAARIHDEAQPAPPETASPTDETVIVTDDQDMAQVVEQGMDFFSLFDDILPDDPVAGGGADKPIDESLPGFEEEAAAAVNAVLAGGESKPGSSASKRGRVIVNPTPPVGSVVRPKKATTPEKAPEVEETPGQANETAEVETSTEVPAESVEEASTETPTDVTTDTPTLTEESATTSDDSSEEEHDSEREAAPAT